MSGRLVAFLVALAICLGAVAGAVLAGFQLPGGSAAVVVPSASASAAPNRSSNPAGRTPSAPASGASTSPSASPAPTSSPTPVLVPGPLDGMPVTAAVAALHPIAVMVDDHPDARPQSGFSAASIVWQAPAEGGIPRYMLIFQGGDAAAIGPVRSAREYFVEWASEWAALYAHVGGSPQALATLNAKGQGQLVYNADEFRFGGGAGYLWRIRTRVAPHNVYTDTAHLRKLAGILGATSAPDAAWLFGPPAALSSRPVGGSIEIDYPWNRITYAYDRASNTYLRSTGGVAQVDAGSKRRVAPANVVILQMQFGPLNDGQPQKLRLEAQDVGSGPAWISTNGVTIKGTWRKASVSAKTLLFDAAGNPVVLTAGQTFVQVVPNGTKFSIRPGTRPGGNAQ